MGVRISASLANLGAAAVSSGSSGSLHVGSLAFARRAASCHARVRRWYVVGRRAGAVASDAGVLEFRVGGVGPVGFWGRCFAGAV